MNLFHFIFGEQILLERHMYAAYNYIIDNQKCIIQSYYFEITFIYYYLGINV